VSTPKLIPPVLIAPGSLRDSVDATLAARSLRTYGVMSEALPRDFVFGEAADTPAGQEAIKATLRGRAALLVVNNCVRPIGETGEIAGDVIHEAAKIMRAARTLRVPRFLFHPVRFEPGNEGDPSGALAKHLDFLKTVPSLGGKLSSLSDLLYEGTDWYKLRQTIKEDK